MKNQPNKKTKGLDKIFYPDKRQAECTYKNCPDYGEYYKCYFDKMFLDCPEYYKQFKQYKK